MIPKKLSLKNFLSHDNSFIDFDKFNTALILGTHSSQSDQSNGAGKCLAGCTVLTHALTGERIEIKDLYESGREDFYVFGLDKSLKLNPAKVVAVSKTGVKNIIKITANNGMSEFVSETHPIMTGIFCTTIASNIKIGDVLACPNKFGPNKCFHRSDGRDFDIYWGTVKWVECVGQCETYDIQIDNDTHLYALDAFVTHNSAIFESISWSLFGKSRHKKKNGVIKWDTNSCAVKFDFECDDGLYRIVRTRNKTASDSDVLFYKFDGSDFQNISGDTNTATDQKIIDTIHINYDVFVNSVYFKQNDISTFADSTPSRRKDVLKALLQINKWDKYQNRAKDIIKTLTIKIEEKNKNNVSPDKINADIENCDSEIIKTKSEISVLNKKYIDINNKLLERKILIGESCTEEDIRKEIDSLVAEKKRVDNRISSVGNRIKENNSLIKNNLDSVPVLNNKILELNKLIKNGSQINIADFRNKITNGKLKEKGIKERIGLLESQINLYDSEKCYVCGEKLSNDKSQKIYNQINEEIDNLKEKQKTLSAQLKKAEMKMAEYEHIVYLADKAKEDKSKLELKLSKLNGDIGSCKSNNNVLENEKRTLLKNDLSEKIDLLRGKLQAIGINDDCDSISFLEKEVRDIKNKIDRLNIEQGCLINKKNELMATLIDQEKVQKELSKLRNDLSLYEKLRDYFGKDGIQSVIIENIIEELENYTNNTLALICNEPTTISIKTQKQNENGTWAETFDISVRAGSRVDDFETFSGGEQFRISLALRLAISSILAKRMGGKIKFLLLDEVTSNLDTKGLDMFMSIITKLSSDMKILVITHSERLKEKFDNIIVVDKDHSGSKINFC